ncbi:glutamate racemase [Bacillus cereus]|nr:MULTISPECIES: glutamate racemase [Bacillus cereus group]
MKWKPKVVVVFDSGVGGLTVLRELKKHNIKEEFVYLADSANSPYGDKTKEQIIISVLNCFKQLSYIYDFKTIIIACNTASVYTKELLQHIYNIPVLSVVDAATDYIKSKQIKETIDVLATNLTAKSHAYKNQLPEQSVREIGCPSFVHLIESDKYFSKEARKNTVANQLVGLNTERGKYVVLGCTHYPLLEEEIKDFYGPQCSIINPSKLLGESISRVFNERSQKFEVLYYTTAPNPYFDLFASRLMDENVQSLLLSSKIKELKNDYLKAN